MKYFLLFFLFSLSTHAASDFRLFWWQESRDEKTSEKTTAFFLAHELVKQMFEADARGDSKMVEALAPKIPDNARIYVVLLKGELKSYSKETIRLFDGPRCGTEYEIASGQVHVDLKAKTVRVDLKLTDKAKADSYEGNGTYEISVGAPSIRFEVRQ